jgi:hypothetical protein
MNTKKHVSRPLASLNLPRPVPAFIAAAKHFVQSLTGNASFPSPTPPLTTVSAAIAALETAQSAAQARTHGATTLRDEKRSTVESLLGQLRTYVQTVADGNPEAASSLIESAGLSVRKPTVRAKRVFAARPGVTSGTVKLVTESAGPRTSYEWQYSVDGGKTWVPMPSTIQASTTLMGMTPGTSMTFRYRVVNKTGEGNWGQTVAFTVQ